jgi:hypothetical protein
VQVWNPGDPTHAAETASGNTRRLKAANFI